MCVTPPPWHLWCRLEAEAPGLPLEPINLRRVWWLPPGVRPLNRGEGLLTVVRRLRSTWAGDSAPSPELRPWAPARGSVHSAAQRTPWRQARPWES